MHVQYQDLFAGVLLPPLGPDFPQVIYEVAPELIFLKLYVRLPPLRICVHPLTNLALDFCPLSKILK